MNQLELAKASGVGAATVARLEAGTTQDDPRISTLRKLADALGVDPRDLHAIRMYQALGLDMDDFLADAEAAQKAKAS